MELLVQLAIRDPEGATVLWTSDRLVTTERASQVETVACELAVEFRHRLEELGAELLTGQKP